MKYILTAFLAFALTACSVKPESGEIVRMPKGYTKEQTQQFVQLVVNDELIREIHQRFPNISKQKQGRFDYQPVFMKGFDTKGIEYGVITKITGLEGWDRRDEFKQFLISYLKDEVKKLTPNHH